MQQNYHGESHLIEILLHFDKADESRNDDLISGYNRPLDHLRGSPISSGWTVPKRQEMAVMMEGAAVAMAVRSAVWRMIIRKAYGVRTGPIIRVVVERRVRNGLGAAFYKVNMVVCPIRILRGALPSSLPHRLSFVLEPVVSYD